MSESREIWFVRTRRTGATYPVTWQGWLASIAFVVFVIVMIGLAAIVAVTAFAVGAVVFVFLVAFAYLRFVLRRSRASRKPPDDRDYIDA